MFKCFRADCLVTSPLHRQNPKGGAGIWACPEHNTQPLDPLVEEIVDIIEEDNVRTKQRE